MANYSDLTGVTVDDVTIQRTATGALEVKNITNSLLSETFSYSETNEVSSGTTGSFATLRTITFNKAVNTPLLVSFQIRRSSTSGSGWFQLQKNSVALAATEYQVLQSVNVSANNLIFLKYAATPTQIETKTDGSYISVSIIVKNTFAINDTLKFAINNNVASSTMYIKEISIHTLSKTTTSGGGFITLS